MYCNVFFSICILRAVAFVCCNFIAVMLHKLAASQPKWLFKFLQMTCASFIYLNPCCYSQGRCLVHSSPFVCSGGCVTHQTSFWAGGACWKFNETSLHLNLMNVLLFPKFLASPCMVRWVLKSVDWGELWDRFSIKILQSWMKN